MDTRKFLIVEDAGEWFWVANVDQENAPQDGPFDSAEEAAQFAEAVFA